MLSNCPVNDEVGGAIYSEEEVTEPQGDLNPDDTEDTTSVRVVSVQPGLVEILAQVDEEPGDVADDVQEDDSSQRPG